MKTNYLWRAMIVVAVIMTGCSRPPQQEMETAAAMIEEARGQQADLYAGDLFTAAEDSLAEAQTIIEVQNGKFALTRDYDRAEALLASASNLAAQAKDAVDERKAQMRLETEALITQVLDAQARAEALHAQAPRGKEGHIALASIGTDIESIDAVIVEVEQLLDLKQVSEAHARAQMALEQALGLVQELEQAIDKTRPVTRS